MTIQTRHYCRNKHCRTKLKAPVENLHHAFCTPGCYRSFYLSRCLVCEEMRRKREDQRFKSGHVVCRREYSRFPGAYDPPSAGFGYRGSQSVDEAPRNPINTGTESAHWRDGEGKGWSWEADEFEHRLFDREGKLAARIEASVGPRWRLTYPTTIRVQSAPDLDAGKRLATSAALANLPDPRRRAAA